MGEQVSKALIKLMEELSSLRVNKLILLRSIFCISFLREASLFIKSNRLNKKNLSLTKW